MRICFCCLKLLHCCNHQVIFKTLLCHCPSSPTFSERWGEHGLFIGSLWKHLLGSCPRSNELLLHQEQRQWRSSGFALSVRVACSGVTSANSKTTWNKTVRQLLYNQFHKHQHLFIIIFPLWRRHFPISAGQKASPPPELHSQHLHHCLSNQGQERDPGGSHWAQTRPAP